MPSGKAFQSLDASSSHHPLIVVSLSDLLVHLMIVKLVGEIRLSGHTCQDVEGLLGLSSIDVRVVHKELGERFLEDQHPDGSVRRHPGVDWLLFLVHWDSVVDFDLGRESFDEEIQLIDAFS